MPVRYPARRRGVAICGACLRIACASALLGACGAARAAEWFVDGSLGERLEYDDNVGLNSRDKVSDFSSQSTLRLDFGGQTETLELGLRSRFDYTVFLDERDLDSDDQRVAGYGSYRTPLGRWGLTAAYDRDTTRTRDEDDTGRFILENVRRQEVEVKPSWSYQLTPEDSLILRGEYNDVRFKEQLVDYMRYGGEAGWAHQLNEVNEIDLFALASLTEPDSELNKKTQVYGLQAGWGFTPLRGLDIRIVGGAYWAKTSFDPPSNRSGSFDDETSVGALPAVSISYQIDPRSTVAANYSRSIRPSGSGEVLERDTLDASLTHNWSPQGSWDIQFRYRAQRSLEDNGRADRDLVRVMPSVTWQFTDAWSLRGSYRFRWQSLEGDSKDAFSNAAMLTLTYQPLKWRLIDD